MSKIGQIPVSKLLDTMNLTLEDYAKGVDKVLEQASDKAGKEAEEELHRTSPVREKNGGDYRRSWTYEEKTIRRGKRNFRTEMVVWNPKHYRLTHLLEKSPRIANKYGYYGKSNPKPHIAPAQKTAEQTFEKVFKEGLGRIRI